MIATFSIVALAVTLGRASAIGNLQPRGTRNTGSLLDGLTQDVSGLGFNRLTTDGIVESVNGNGEIIAQVQLPSDEAAEIKASVLSGKQTDNTNILLKRACPFKNCVNNSDCPSSCPRGCFIVCVFIPITGTNQCNVGACLAS